MLQARDAITAVLSMRPETAVLAASGQEVPADDVAVATLILVRPGAKVPLDGWVEKGSSSMDESMLTGGARESSAAPQGAHRRQLAMVVLSFWAGGAGLCCGGLEEQRGCLTARATVSGTPSHVQLRACRM